MTWQKVTKYVSDESVVVENKAGDTYPVVVDRQSLAQSLYSQLQNRAHDHKTYWGWVDFDGDEATLEDYTVDGDGSGPPQSPPWEHA